MLSVWGAPWGLAKAGSLKTLCQSCEPTPSVMLQVLDQQWKEHLLSLDQLRQGISLRAYAQKDPLNEYKREAFLMFDAMLASMRETTSMVLSHVELRSVSADDGDESKVASDRSAPAAAPQKVTRNAPCPCGSGKKYKHCHGAITA